MMLAITLNPGFVLLAAAFVVLAAPSALRAFVIAAAGAGAMWLVLRPEFGAYDPFAQIGLTVVPFTLDALNQVFGIAFITMTILLALYGAGRRNRVEDTAITLLSGAAVSALFVGDLISFVAALSLSGLAAVWVVMASPQPGAGAAGVRLLIWHGLEGLLLLVGVAFHWAGSSDSVFTQLSARSVGGAFIFAALLIRIGAPLAHVWLKDAIGHASSSGAAALSAFSSMLGAYALIRLYPAEPILIPLGAAMIVIGLFFAAAEDDLRRGGAYAMLAQTGVCVALIGIGTPLALAGAAAHAFTTIFAFVTLQMALGVLLWKRGQARASTSAALFAQMPTTAFFITLAGFAAAAAPGFASYASLAVALEAATRWELRALWALFSVCSAALVAALAVRPALAFARRSPKTQPGGGAAPFPMLLGYGLGAFFCIAIGLAPGWLYRLTPTSELAFDAYSAARLGPHLHLLGAAGLLYLVIRAIGLGPADRPVIIFDVDGLYRGPIAGAGRWTGVVLLRVYGASRTLWAGLIARASRAFRAWSRACDQPYAARWAGAVQFATIAGMVLLILLMRL